MNSSTALNPLYDPHTDNQVIPQEVQKLINQPLKDEQGLSVEDQAFLEKIQTLISEKKINLYDPDSLLNQEVYEKLNLEAKGKADQNAVLMLARIREIHDLLQISSEPSYQLQNLVASLRLYKERTEAYSGDIFLL